VTASAQLLEVFEEARRLGYIGPGDLDNQMVHARGFATAYAAVEAGQRPGHVLDLGSGGGLPGLVLAEEWPGARVTLVESSRRRSDFLRRAVDRGRLGDRVTVLEGRAEQLGRDPAWRQRVDLVVARSFGSPAVTAECGAPFLRAGGWLVVSEPPAEQDRWPAEALAQLGLSGPVFVRQDFAFCALRQDEPCPERFPRRVGVPAKRPLF